MIAEHLPQRFVQQMGGRVILPDGAAPRMIDIQVERSPDFEAALLDRAEMHEEVAGALLRVGDRKAHAVARHHAGIADLPAGFGVEWRLVENDGTAFAFLQGGHFLAVAQKRDHHAGGGFRLVAEEIGAAVLLAQREPDGLVGSLARPRP